MNRRTFLKALGATLAAAAIPAPVESAASFLAPTPVLTPPVIDWTAWNWLEVQSGPTGVFGRINGVDVSPFPDLMRKLARCIRVDPESQTVTFGTADCALGGGFRFDIPQLDATHPIIVGVLVRLDHSVSILCPQRSTPLATVKGEYIA